MHLPMFRQTGRPTPGHPTFERISQGFIIGSMVILSLSTMKSLDPALVRALNAMDFVIGLGFAAEYGLRIYFAKDRLKYIFSFWGLVDFVAVVPSLFLGGSDLRALRALRLLRLIRLLKLYRTSKAMRRLSRAFDRVKQEFFVFALMSFVIFYVAAVGIYTFEHEAQPDAFPSVPASMWWAAATLTTVGYGDVYPITAAGRIFTVLILFVGLGLVAVPAGLLAAALQNETDDPEEEQEPPLD